MFVQPLLQGKRINYCIFQACLLPYVSRMQRAYSILSSVACQSLKCSHILSQKGTIFERTLLKIKCVLWFSLQMLSETLLILTRTERDITISVLLIFMYSTRYSCQILMTLEFSRQIFEKYPITKFYGNPSGRNRVVLCGRRDGRTDR